MVPSIFTPHEYKGLTLVDGGLLNPIPIAPTFKDRTDLTIAVNLNAGPSQRGGEGEESDEGADDEAIDDGYSARIRQFLDGIGESLRPTGASDLSVFELLNRSFETMQNAIAAVKLAAYAPDVVIEVPRDYCGAHEFYRAREIIDLGYRLAAEALPPRMAGSARPGSRIGRYRGRRAGGAS